MRKFKSLEFLAEKIREDEFGEVLQDWKWIFSYSRRYKWKILAFTILGIISTTFGLVSSVTNKYMVDIVTGRQAEKLWVVVVIWISSNILAIVLSGLSTRYAGKISTLIKRDVQTDVFGRILRADWQALRAYSNGELLDRLNGDADTIGANAISWVPNIVVSVYNFVATFVVIWHYSKGMSFIAVGSAPILFFVSRALMLKAREYQKKNREMSSQFYTFETESFSRMDTVKSMGLIDLFVGRFGKKQREMRDLQMEINGFQIRRNVIMQGINMLITGIAFAYALFLLWTGAITYGTMVLFLQQRARLTQSMLNVAEIIPSFVNSSVSARRVSELLELPAERGGSDEEELPDGGVHLQLRDVAFAYEEETGRVIEDGSLQVGPGEIVALVGPSGRGKTTILRLILGLVYPQSGECVLRDVAGNEIEVNADSRSLIAYVPQGNTLFSGTIGDNLRLVRPNATEEEMRHVLEMADAWEFVARLPEGVETPVWENGKGLSEGQAQRVAIARALLREAPILLLDEATSALDIETEERVLKNIREEVRERACIVTTHRPSVLAICDRIYRVKDGTIARAEA